MSYIIEIKNPKNKYTTYFAGYLGPAVTTVMGIQHAEEFESERFAKTVSTDIKHSKVIIKSNEKV